MMLIAFDSTQQALLAEMMLEFAEVEIDTLPTPKEVTAGCALSIEFPRSDFSIVKEVLKEERIQIRGIFSKSAEGYTLVYVQEEEK